MKKRTFVSIALAVALVLALTAPAFAQSASYSYDLNMDGTIDQKTQVGHTCNTGAELKQTITGTGTLTKALDAAMVRGKLTVTDTNDFVTAANAVRNLTVTSVIELCAPPKMTYEDNALVWAPTDPTQVGNFAWGDDYFVGVVHPLGWYWPDIGAGGTYPAYWTSDMGWSGWNDINEIIPTLGEFEKLTKQIWAVQVEANPGFSGNLHQDFEAAYGPYYGVATIAEDGDMPDAFSDHWGWQFDEDGNRVVIAGDHYVGNYFNIEQMARTSMGVVRQYYDVSSPWSHGLFKLDSTITGMSEQTEKFSMDNLDAGSDAADNWWNLF